MYKRQLYNWVIENIFGTAFPKQREFARLNMTNTVTVSYTHLDVYKRQVYCRTGRRSADAVQKLESLGYTNLRDLGGILSWPYAVSYTHLDVYKRQPFHIS